ncbi:MAG: hypothetical protein ACRDSL_17205 [Pseudonocardiaceae bacterium]
MAGTVIPVAPSRWRRVGGSGPVDCRCCSHVLVDGWLHKFFAKLLLQGFTEPDLSAIFDRVRMPDSALLLLADVGAVYDPRSDFRPAELGMHASYSNLTHLNRGTFVDYQTRAALDLQKLADSAELGRPPSEDCISVSTRVLLLVASSQSTMRCARLGLRLFDVERAQAQFVERAVLCGIVVG